MNNNSNQGEQKQMDRKRWKSQPPAYRLKVNVDESWKTTCLLLEEL